MLGKGKKCTISAVVATVLGILLAWTVWANKALELNRYTVSSDCIPDAFGGYRIAHISDLHNAEIGNDNEKLLTMLAEAKPDLIAITGDLVDSRNTDADVALRFAAEAVKIAPCYYVSGNHEARISEYAVLKQGLTDLGVTVLDDEGVVITQNDASVLLIGVEDPSFRTDYLFGDAATVMQQQLELLTGDMPYTILLSHRPELFEVYVENEIDLVLSGHAHGGQVRLPFVGGLVAPNQGLFPVFDAGVYKDNNTHMIVSRGIGNSIIPLRVNNRPEIVLIELES